MPNLPEDMLIQIFTLLPPSDLLSTTLVCKTFNSIISTSTKLLSKFNISFNHTKVDTEWIGSRPYPRVSIQPTFFTQFLPVIDTIIEDTVTLSVATIFSHNIEKSSPNEVDLKRLLLKAQKLKNLRIEFRRFTMFQPDDEPKLKLSLNSLNFIGGEDFLALFLGCQVRKFELTTFDAEASDNLRKFLMSQRQLDDLDLSSVREGLFADDSLVRAEFKLENLKFGSISDDEVGNFIKFLAHHENSLRHINLCGCQTKILELLARFKGLKMLTMDAGFFPLQTTARMAKIQNLTVLHCVDFNDDWAASFPNLEELTLVSLRKCTGLAKLLKLRTLSIKGCAGVPQMNIPQVKTLTLDCMQWESHSGLNNIIQPNLEELHVVTRNEMQCIWLEELRNSEIGRNLRIFVEKM